MAPLQRSKSVIQADQLQIQHFIHQHLLHKAFMTSEFNCDGCNTGGDGVRFRCSACDFDLHEQCATASHRIISNLHPQHHLILVNRPGGSHVCDVCKGVINGLSYTCESQSCQFNVHNLCINHQQQMPSMVFGGYNGVINSQPVMVNHHQHTMQFGGVNTSQPVMVNHQQKQGIATTELGGYDHGVNNNQTQMINHSYQQQGVPMTGVGGYNGVNNHQPVMVNHLRQQPMQGVASVAFGGNHGVKNHQPLNYLREQPKQGVASAAFGGNHGFNNNQSQMINHQQQRFGGYQGGMNSQPVMVNHHQQQQQVAFNNNQQLMTNHHQQFQQQHGIALPTTVGGYNVVNNNQTVMISHPPPPPPPPPQQQSNGYTKVGKLAANILSTSLIGIPLFNSRN